MNTTSPDLAGPVAASVPAAIAPAPDLPPAFPRQPGETPRAFGAFLAFFQLGHGRSLATVAEALGENPATVKNWSSKYHWSDRVNAFQSGLLQAQVQARIALQHQSAADWARRTREYRENEWAAGQKLHAAVRPMPFQELQIQFPVIAGNLRSFLVTLRSQSGGAKFAVAPKKFSRNFQLRWPRKGVTQTFDTNLNLVFMASLFAGCTIRAFCGRCHAELISNFVKFIFRFKTS
jgi:hypothetical protein